MKNLAIEIELFLNSLDAKELNEVYPDDRKKISSLISKKIKDIKITKIISSGPCIECGKDIEYEYCSTHSIKGDIWLKELFLKWSKKRKKFRVKERYNDWSIGGFSYNTLKSYMCDNCKNIFYQKLRQGIKAVKKENNEIKLKHDALKKWLWENLDTVEPKILLRNYINMCDKMSDSHEYQLHEAITIRVKLKEVDSKCSVCNKKFENLYVLIEDQLEKYGIRTLPFKIHEHMDLIQFYCSDCNSKRESGIDHEFIG